MNKQHLILWIMLVALTISSYLSSEFLVRRSSLVAVLLGITAVKFFGVGFQFMELKKAHLFWKVSFVLIFLGFSALVLGLT
ncbi:MAG TPA: hypothetical protein ENJ53_00320 [Phaeodactylibacter sp.]|nr:hypothetical protein [Phaeodactylibacter sp.]